MAKSSQNSQTSLVVLTGWIVELFKIVKTTQIALSILIGGSHSNDHTGLNDHSGLNASPG